MQSERSRRLKAYFLTVRSLLTTCMSYLSSNWVVNLTNASAVSVQLSSTLKRRYSLQLEWQHRVYSVHSQHRAIQGDNYDVLYYSQLMINPFWTGVHLQGHPTTVFCKISVRGSKYCLAFSNIWGWLKISWWLFHSCTILEAFPINPLPFSEV